MGTRRLRQPHEQVLRAALQSAAQTGKM